jgi:hypothetical protein
MKRRLFSATAFMSLLLCAVTVVLWVRSYWISDLLESSPYCDVYLCESHRGSLLFEHQDLGDIGNTPTNYFWFFRGWSPPEDWMSRGSSFLGFSVYSGPMPTKTLEVVVPCWILCVVFAPLPAFWTFHRLRQGRSRGELSCQICSYNLL